MTVCVERIAEVGVQEARIEAARAVDPALLGDGKDNLQIAVRDVLLLQLAQGLKDGDDAYVKADIEAVVRAAGGKALTKVIIETCLLTDEEKRRACLLAKEAGADFVKTSTGFAAGGATAADVRLMRESVGEAMGVKASGGIRSRADAEAMLAAGATRLGTSSGVKIVEA